MYRLIQGDYKLLDDISVDLILTSPPYNIGSAGPRKDGKRHLGQYDTKSFGAVRSYPDNLPEEEYQASQREFLQWAASKITPNGLILYNHKPRHKKGILIHPMTWFPSELVLHEEIIWDRGSTHNHCQQYCYQQTERIYALKRSATSRPFVNRKELTGDVWRISRVFGEKTHDATFPLELARRCIRLWCPEGGTVCDPYSGSGTTMLAAILENRNFVGSELQEKFVARTHERLQELLPATS